MHPSPMADTSNGPTLRFSMGTLQIRLRGETVWSPRRQVRRAHGLPLVPAGPPPGPARPPDAPTATPLVTGRWRPGGAGWSLPPTPRGHGCGSDDDARFE